MTDPSMVAVGGDLGSGHRAATITLIADLLAEDATRQAVVICPTAMIGYWERATGEQNVPVQVVSSRQFAGVIIDRSTILVIDNDAFHGSPLDFETTILDSAASAEYIIWTRVPSPASPVYPQDQRAADAFLRAATIFQLQPEATIDGNVTALLARKQRHLSDLLSN